MNRDIFIWNGNVLIVVGAIAAFIQTKAYGNNIVPQSTPEALCDVACLFIVVIGYVLSVIGYALPKIGWDTKNLPKMFK